MEYSMEIRTVDTRNNSDVFHKYHAEQKKPNTKEYIPYDFIYVKFQKGKTYL